MSQNLHEKANELAREEQARKLRAWKILTFYAEPDIADMDERFNKAYSEAKVKIDRVREELAGLESDYIDRVKDQDEKLRAKADELTRDIEELEKEITRQHGIIAVLAESISRNEEVNKNTKDIYEHKLKGLDSLSSELSTREVELTNRWKVFENEQNTNRIVLKNIEDGMVSLQIQDEDLNKKRDEYNLYMTRRNKEIEAVNDEAVIKKESAQELFNEASKALRDAQDREANAKDVLNRIDEAKKMESNSIDRENVNLRELERLNALGVKNRADSKNNTMRSEALDERERKLNERESNIKALEADLNKGE
jgi:chromosome segregation ATPase